jgi:hypothetical protein
MRFKRLAQPKYLFGAIVGGLYKYWYFGGLLFGIGRRGPWRATTTASAQLATDPLLYESPARSSCSSSFSWRGSFRTKAPTFTEAEVKRFRARDRRG